MIRLHRHSVFVSLYLNCGMILEIIELIIKILFGNTSWFSPIRMAILYSLLFTAIISNIIRKNAFFCVGSVVLGLLLIISYHINHQLPILFRRIVFYSFGYVIAVAGLIQSINKPKQLLSAFIPYVYFSLLYCVLEVIDFQKTGVYSMAFSYSTIISAIYCLLLGKEKRTYWAYFCIILFTDLLCGSRGCILCFAIAFLLYAIFGESSSRRTLLLSVFVLVVVILVYNYSLVARLLLRVLPNSRTLLYLSINDLHLSGRDVYYGSLMQEIVRSHFRFHGLFSDRFYMAKYFGRVSMEDIFASYSHNFVIEILFQFGWLGFIILPVFFIMLFRTLSIVKNCGDKDVQYLYVVFFSFAVGQLSVSSSYLTAISFGELIGMMLLVQKKYGKNRAIIKLRRKKRITEL